MSDEEVTMYKLRCKDCKDEFISQDPPSGNFRCDLCYVASQETELSLLRQIRDDMRTLVKLNGGV